MSDSVFRASEVSKTLLSLENTAVTENVHKHRSLFIYAVKQ